MRRVLSSLLGVVFFGLLSVAIIGAIVVLVGALFHSSAMKDVGASMAKVGSLGLLAVFATPFGKFLAYLSRNVSKPRELGDGK
jgi:hypothetical protein